MSASRPNKKNAASTPPREAPSARPVAVIDVGTSSIRMAIAEIGGDGGVRRLDTLSQAVSLGRDAFTRGIIRKSTVEDCVRVLKSYRKVLDEYQITQPDQIRVVATSAVREAANRLAFLDRVYSATGMEIEPIDEAEVSRITYLSIQPLLKAEPALAGARTVISEVGGGSTEVLVVRGDDVEFSRTYRLGSLRLRQTLEAHRAPLGRRQSIMQNQIERTVGEIALEIGGEGRLRLIALGGDVRFAVSQLLPDHRAPPDHPSGGARWSGGLDRLDLDELRGFTRRMLRLSVDELVQRFHLSFPDAETLGPALLTYVEMARALKLEEILVSSVNLRDGLLQEFAMKGAWTEDFNRQIIRSALVLGRKFQFDEQHATHVAELSRTVFRALANEHQLEPRYELLLYVAAILHEIGHFVGVAAHHKHSMYLIRNSELFGLGKTDLLLVALVARYHRRASPKPNHEGYATLARDQRIAVSKMAAMLRTADALDRAHSRRIKDIRCACEPGRFLITVPGAQDLSLEQLALREKGPLFEEVFGMQVLLRSGGGE